MAKVLVKNPYEMIDWDNVQPRKANFHCHTQFYDAEENGHTEEHAVRTLIEAYEERKYDIVGITDHNNYVVPEDFNVDTDEDYPEMLIISGNELSNGHHMISLANDLDGGYDDDVNERVKEVARRRGMSWIAHPGRIYSTDPKDINPDYSYLESSYKTNHSCIGIEGIHVRNDMNVGQLYAWRKMLSDFLPYNLPKAVGVDDYHVYTREHYISRVWTTLFLPRLDKGAVLSALWRGEFYISRDPDGANPDRHNDGVFVPTINKITTDEEAGTITIDADNWTEINWLSGTEAYNEDCIVATGTTFNYKENENLENFAIAEIKNDEGQTYTQGFGFSDRKEEIHIDSQVGRFGTRF